MSEPQTNVSPIASKIRPLQSYVSGMIVSRRRISGQSGTMWLTVLKTPSEDSFSHPETVEVRSHAPLGDVNEIWSGLTKIGGYPRNYNTKPDPETGEIKAVKSAQLHLTVVEA